MTIGFNQIPATIRAPFVAVEFDSTRAQQGPALLPYRVLIIGQRTSAGTAVANSVHKVSSADQVLGKAGRGVLSHRMAIAYFANNRFTETYIGVLDDNGSGVSATGTLTFTGPTTAAGTFSLYVGGVLVSVAIASGTTAANVAAAVTAAVGANLDLPVTAAQGSGGSTHVVTLTARNDGTPGNDIDLRTNYQDGQALPAGLGVTIGAMASGATNSSLSTLIANLGDDWYQLMVLPYTDATSLTAIETELLSRDGPTRMVDGVAIAASNLSLGSLSTLGDSRNSRFLSIAATNQSPTPTYEVAAAIAAVTAYYGNIDPARPFQTLPLAGVLPPAEADRFTFEERNLLLYDGISTLKSPPTGGPVQIERLITTEQTNAAGAPDTSYLDVTTRLTLMYLRYAFRQRIATKFPRHKLANDGTRFGAGQPVVTPLLAKAEALFWFKDMEDLGLVENSGQFRQDLVVERDGSDPNRLNFILPPDLINSLIVVAAQVQFRL